MLEVNVTCPVRYSPSFLGTEGKNYATSIIGETTNVGFYRETGELQDPVKKQNKTKKGRRRVYEKERTNTKPDEGITFTGE